MKKWILSLTILLQSCSQQPTLEDPKPSNKQQLANQIRYRVAAKAKKELDLRPTGTIGQMLREVQKLGLSFYYYKPLDIVEGRKCLVKLVHMMLDEMNQDEAIRPYLGQYPMRPWNTEMIVFLRAPDGRDLPEGELCILSAIDSNLQYQIHDPKTGRLVTIYQETFEEALERIADPSLPLVVQKKQEVTQKMPSCMSIGFVDSKGRVWQLDENGKLVGSSR